MKPFRRLYCHIACCLCLLVFVTIVASCNNNQAAHSASRNIVADSSELFSMEAFAETLAATLPPVDSTDSVYRERGVHDAGGGMHFVYQSTGYNPLWLTEDGVTEAAELLLQDLDSLRNDGIDPGRYGVKDLYTALNSLKSRAELQTAIAFDTACTRAYLQASRDLLMGVLLPRTADSLWYHSNDAGWHAPRELITVLSGNGSYPPLAKYRSLIPTYALLRAEYARYIALAADTVLRKLKARITGNKVRDSIAIAIISRELPWIQPVADDSMKPAGQRIRGFQERYGLAPTGKIDSITARRLRLMPDTIMHMIAANMERLRWMPQSLASQHVLVDIPLMELFYRKDGIDAFHMKVVVGKPSRQTPVLNANMANVVFSPSWGVPPTILKQDVLPGIAVGSPGTELEFAL